MRNHKITPKVRFFLRPKSPSHIMFKFLENHPPSFSKKILKIGTTKNILRIRINLKPRDQSLTPSQCTIHTAIGLRSLKSVVLSCTIASQFLLNCRDQCPVESAVHQSKPALVKSSLINLFILMTFVFRKAPV